MEFTVQHLSDKIDAENEAFEKMTKAEKRVVIAQDCLLRIGFNQIIPTEATFCTLNSEFDDSDKSVKAILNSTSKSVCRACAKGGLFMSYLGRVNNMNFDEIEPSNNCNNSSHKKLLEIFTIRQLSLIEFAYEGKQYIHYSKNNKEMEFDYRKIRKFRNKIKELWYDCDNDDLTFENMLLVEICNIIIKNKGTFKL